MTQRVSEPPSHWLFPCAQAHLGAGRRLEWLLGPCRVTLRENDASIFTTPDHDAVAGFLIGMSPTNRCSEYSPHDRGAACHSHAPPDDASLRSRTALSPHLQESNKSPPDSKMPCVSKVFAHLGSISVIGSLVRDHVPACPVQLAAPDHRAPHARFEVVGPAKFGTDPPCHHRPQARNN